MARPLLCDRPIDSSALPAELLWLPGEILQDPDVDEGRAPEVHRLVESAARQWVRRVRRGDRHRGFATVSIVMSFARVSPVVVSPVVVSPVVGWVERSQPIGSAGSRQDDKLSAEFP